MDKTHNKGNKNNKKRIGKLDIQTTMNAQQQQQIELLTATKK